MTIIHVHVGDIVPKVPVSADCDTFLAVVRRGRRHWGVYHIPSGLRMVVTRTRAGAYSIRQRLLDTGIDFSTTAFVARGSPQRATVAHICGRTSEQENK